MTGPEPTGRTDSEAAASPRTPPPLAEALPEPAAPATGPKSLAERRAEAAARAARPSATPRQIEAADQRLRQANLLRIRGELKQSLAELVKAIEANPYDPEPHVLSGDILRNVGRPDDAIDEYERAVNLAADPATRGAAEAKLARLVMEQEELNSGSRPVLDEEISTLDRSGAAIIAASAILPGLGQWLAGKRVRAVIYWILVAAAISIVPAISVAGGRGSVAAFRVFVTAAPCALVWLAAMIDACIEANRSSRKG